MALKFNPITGNFDLVGESTPTAPYRTNSFTLTSQDIDNKYIVLTNTPSKPLSTRLIVEGGPEQFYGDSFIVTPDNDGKRVSWDGLFLDGVLESDDKIIVIYI